MKGNTSLLNRENWSENRFAFCYAVLILLMALLFHFILKSSGIKEVFALRLMNIFFIIIGFLLLLWDYIKTTNSKLNDIKSFWLSAKCGLIFCALFLPILMFNVSNDPEELKWIANEFYTTSSPVFQVGITTLMTTIPSIVIAGVAVSFFGGIWSKKQTNRSNIQIKFLKQTL